MIRTKRLAKVITMGFIAVFAAALLCELTTSPSSGHRIDLGKLPPEAQAILKEQPGMPISVDQWNRLDKVVARSGGWPSGAKVFLASVRQSWYWFVILPLLGLGILFIRWKEVTILHVSIIFSPSLGFLLLAFQMGASGLKD